jgi:hypothetical protein
MDACPNTKIMSDVRVYNPICDNLLPLLFNPPFTREIFVIDAVLLLTELTAKITLSPVGKMLRSAGS